MLSLGMFSFFAARIAVRRRGLEFASPPPMRAAMVISRMILVKTRPRLASVAAFLCLMVAHFECPDITNPRFSRGPAWPGPTMDVITRRNGVGRNRPFTVAKETTPVRRLTVNRKPLRNYVSLAQPSQL